MSKGETSVTRSSNARRLATTVVSGAMAALALAGCNKTPTAAPAAADATAATTPADVPAPSDALPLTDASDAPLAIAPPADALPTAPPVRVAQLRDPNQGYAYLDKATSMRNAFADAPPDYTYDYQGVRPWVWRSADNATQLVEPLADGNRSYYYQPGASLPYLISDGQYSYGYDSGALVIVYDDRGRPLPPVQVEGRANLASRYLQRARAIYQASMKAQRMAVARDHWLTRRREWQAEQTRWEDGRAQDAAWRAYHQKHADDEAARWAAERYQRQAEAARMADRLHDKAAAQRAWQAALAARDRASARAIAGGGNGNGQPGGPLRPLPVNPPANPPVLGRPPGPIGPSPAQQAASNAQAAATARAEAVRQAQMQAQAAARQQAAAQNQARQQALGAQIARERAQAQTQAQQQALAKHLAQQQALAAQAQRQKLIADQAQARAQAQAASQANQQARAQAAAQSHAQAALAAAQAKEQAHAQAAQAAAQARVQARAQAAQSHPQAKEPKPQQVQPPAAAKAEAIKKRQEAKAAGSPPAPHP